MKHLMLALCKVLTVILWIPCTNPKEILSYYDVIGSYWAWRLELSPEFATAVGNSNHGDRLETFTPQAFKHKQKQCLALLDQVSNVPADSITWRQYIDLKVMIYELMTVRDGYMWSGYNQLNTVNLLEGVHHDYSYWLDATRFDLDEDFEAYINRLRALATQIHEQINLLQTAVRNRWTNHRLSMDSVAESLESLISSPAVATPFFRPFNDSLHYADLSVNRKELFKEQGRLVIHDHLIPAYRKLHAVIVNEYLPHTRPALSISSLTQGAAFYQACVLWYLSYDVSALDLHNMGQVVVAGLVGKITEMKEKMGFSGHVKDFMKYVHGARIFFHQSGQTMLKEYRRMVYKEALPKLPKMFNSYQIPHIQVQPMMFDGPMGIMMPGSEDAAMPAVFFVNINDPFTKPKWKMKALTLHEIIPGRYLQVVYERNQSLPEFRRWREYRKMYSVPFQFPFYNAYTEGWALYAEYLGREMDLLISPFDAFGQLYSELYHACELVVDTGIHSIGWSREEAVDFLTAWTGQPYEAATDAVTRIATLPGQASAPLYGYLKIKELRQRAQWVAGDRFDIREFHDLVLGLGPVPLRLLDEEVESWAHRQKARSSATVLESSKLTVFSFLVLVVSLERL